MKVKLYCFEGEWDKDYPELSVRPLTQVLQHAYQAFGAEFTSTYRFCQNVSRLERNLHNLDGRTLSKQNCHHCFYFAFHGSSKGLFDSESNLLTFDEIANALGNKAENNIVFFGSCGTKASEETLEHFKNKTGAALVIGYGASVDWVTSSTFEMLFFSELRNRKSINPFVKRIRSLAAADQLLFSKLKVIIAH